MSLNETRLEFDVTAPKRIGRTVKFTPERMEQIKNLVERGHSREDIASIIGCTVGSLQVTCSRFGISLRRLPMTNNSTDGGGNDGGNGKRALEPSDFKHHPRDKSPNFLLRATFNNKTFDVALPISGETFSLLAICAEMRGVRLSELITTLLTEGVKSEFEK